MAAKIGAVPDGHLPDEPDTALTAELTTADGHGPVADPASALRRQLPGLEPERHVTDWGRSERLSGIADATVLGFLYNYWFRVEAEGAENVPPSGGALLVSNRAGQVRVDGPMIARAVREEPRVPRPVHLAIEPALADIPGLGMLATKLGSVTAHPANLHRLLLDEQQLVLVFPEPTGGGPKPLRSRYRLRRFDGLGFVEVALRAGVPIVPVAVIGAEEATPALGSLLPLRRLRRRAGLGMPLPLPAKFRVRFLQPVRTDQLGAAPWMDRGLVAELGEEVRSLIQTNLLEMVAQRRSVWLG